MTERAVIAGAGGVSQFWFEAITAEEIEVVAIVDLDVTKADARRREFCPSAEVSDDLETTLRMARPDFVIDLTPPESRLAVTGKALEHGFHVLCEKPLANTMETARAIVKAAEHSGKMCMVSQSRRWATGPATVQQAIADDVIGALSAVHCDFFLGAHFGDFRPSDPDSPEEAYALATSMNRRIMPHPLLADMAVHHFDMARFMTGLNPISVYAHEFNPTSSWYVGACSAVCIFEMSNDVVFSYRGSWSAEGFTTEWNGNWRLVGEEGMLLYENDNLPKAQVVAGTEGFRRPLRDVELQTVYIPHPAMRGAIREILAFLRTGKTPQTTCQDNINSCAMFVAALTSALTGQRVPVSF